MVGSKLRAWFAVALSLVSCLCQAIPSDDHARGVLAYQRGDVVAAMSALREPARAGYAPSQALLAFILDRSDFSEEAFRLYRDAAAQNDAEGHAGLASLYFAGRGVAKDEKLALEHFSKAADLGHAASIETVANAFLKRQMGLDADGPDGAAAVAALTRAAGQDHVASAEALARAYQSGRYGLAADPAQAANWQARAVAIRKKQAAPVAKVSK
ncbi:MAG TPA: tetratricopeptide repeat protein [Burkholderiaceae bacterium]|nr:tetratricopeptide repeat protein [Burkholderiaceae bacterium]